MYPPMDTPQAPHTKYWRNIMTINRIFTEFIEGS